LHKNSPQTTTNKNLLFLIGFMGTGKTHWGKIWAEKLNYSFADLDDLIEEVEGYSVHQLFETRGEDYFRLQEAATLKKMLHKENTIVACGGGTPCFFDNMRWMNTNGTTILLKADAPFILRNIKKQLGTRPLLRGMNDAEMLFFIENKLVERETFYNKATIILDAQTAGIHSLDQIISMK
jgi:shikimate kinase